MWLHRLSQLLLHLWGSHSLSQPTAFHRHGTCIWVISGLESRKQPPVLEEKYSLGYWFTIHMAMAQTRKSLLSKNAWNCKRRFCHSHLHAPPASCRRPRLSHTGTDASALAWTWQDPSSLLDLFGALSKHWKILASIPCPVRSGHPGENMTNEKRQKRISLKMSNPRQKRGQLCSKARHSKNRSSWKDQMAFLERWHGARRVVEVSGHRAVANLCGGIQLSNWNN